MTKILSCIGDFGDMETEGLMKISRKIKDSLTAKMGSHVHVVVNQKSADFYHIHSSGFLPAVWQMRKGKQTLYSLYSHINQGPLDCIRNNIEHLWWYRNQNHPLPRALKMILFATASTFIPVRIKRFFLNRMHQIVVPSEAMKHELGLTSATVVRIGINPQRFKPSPLNKTKIKETNIEKTEETKIKKTKDKTKDAPLVISYFGHNDPLKGLSDVIKAFAELDKRFGPRISLRMYLTKYSEHTANHAHCFSPRIIVSGHVEDIVNVYNESDIIVLPYRSRGAAIGVPLVLVEAMACEKPIVTTNLPFIKEIVQDAALIVDPYAPQQLVENIVLLMNNQKLRTELGKKARRRVLEAYTEKQMFEGYQTLYQTWLSSEGEL